MDRPTENPLHGNPQQVVALLDYQPGAIVSRVVLKQKSGSVTVFAFDAGQELSEHTAPFDALVHVIDGRVRVTITGRHHELEAGQAILMPADQPHALLALTPFKMILTMIRG